MNQDKMTPKDVEKATNALCLWFDSQEIQPGEAITVALLFLSRMIIANNHNAVSESQSLARQIANLAILQGAKP